MTDAQKIRVAFDLYDPEIDAAARKIASDKVEERFKESNVEIVGTYPEGYAGTGDYWSCSVELTVNGEEFSISKSDDEDEYEGPGVIACRAALAWCEEYEAACESEAEKWLGESVWDELDYIEKGRDNNNNETWTYIKQIDSFSDFIRDVNALSKVNPYE